MATKNQQILDAITELKTELQMHIAESAESKRQTEVMYKLFVTGTNGSLPFQERLRNVERWIACLSTVFMAVAIAVSVMFATGKAVLVLK